MLMAQEPSSVIDFLKLIPEYIWILVGVLIAGVLPWVGIYLQLKHDSKEREKERKMSLRRDVYLFAAEKIGQQLNYLANYCVTKESQPEGYREAFAKIEIIGNSETVVSLIKFDDYLIESLFELWPDKAELNFLEIKIDNIRDIYQQATDRAEKCLEEVKEYNKRGAVNPQEWSIIQSELKLELEHAEQLLKDLRKNVTKLSQLTNEIAIKCQQKAQSAEELLIPVIISVRKELGTPIDEEAYRAAMKIHLRVWEKNLEQVIESMKVKYEKFMQDIQR